MLPEEVRKGKRVDRTVDVGFSQIPKNLLDSGDINDCVTNMQKQLSIDPEGFHDQIKQFQDFYRTKTGKSDLFQSLSGSEQEKKHNLHQKCVENFTKGYIDTFLYEDHLKPNFDHDYFAKGIMSTTEDESKDISQNKRISALIERADRKEFKDSDKIKNNRDPQRSADREEFLDHIRQFVSSLDEVDVKKLAEEGISDEKLAENPKRYHQLSLVCEQFSNITKDLKEWGITDPELEAKIKEHEPYKDFFSAIDHRISYLLDPSYEIFDEKTVPDKQVRGDIKPKDSRASEFVIGTMEALNSYSEYSCKSECNAIYSIFEDLGFSKDDIFTIDPKKNQSAADRSTTELSKVLQYKKEGEPFTVYSKLQPDLQLSFGASMDMKLTRMLMGEKKVDFQKAVQKPKELSRWDKFTDFFSGIFTRHKPKAEKYASDVKCYNTLAAIFDPKSVIPTNPPTKNPMHDLLSIRHSLQQENKTKDDYTKIMNRLNEMATNDGKKAAFQNSVKTLTEKFSKQVDAYNEAHPNPKDKIVLKGPVDWMMQTIKQQAARKAQQEKQPVQQKKPVQQEKQVQQPVQQPVQQEIKKGIINEENKKNIIDENIIEGGGHGPQNLQDIIGGRNPEPKKEAPNPEVKKEIKQEIKHEIKQEEPKKEASKPEVKKEIKQEIKHKIKQEEPKPVPAEPTAKELLKRNKEIADIYLGLDPVILVTSMIEGHVSLHEKVHPGDKANKGDPVSVIALFGQAPEKFPGQEGLTPMEKKMQYLENVMTKKDFTKRNDHQQFLTNCRADYKAVQDSAYQSTKTGSDEIQKFINYQNEVARSMQHLAVRPGRMTNMMPMLAGCSKIVKQGLSDFDSKKDLLSVDDFRALSKTEERCDSLQLLGKAYIDSARSEYDLVTYDLGNAGLSKILIAEYFNQTVIAPAQKETTLAEKKNQHPDTPNLDALGADDDYRIFNRLFDDLYDTPTYKALADVKQSGISAAILEQPMKIAAVVEDIATEISTEKPVRADAKTYLNQLFDSKKVLLKKRPDLADPSKPEVKQEIKQEEPKKEAPKPEVKKEIKKEKPKPEIIEEIELLPKPVPAEPTNIESLEKNRTLAKQYFVKDGAKHITAMLQGRVSLHEPISKKIQMEDDDLNFDQVIKNERMITALFGQAPEKFPGENGLSPMEKKMQYLERVLTEKDFTKNMQFKNFREQCENDFGALVNADFNKTEAGSKAIKDCIDYLCEGAETLQHLSVRSPRMSLTTTMLGTCARSLQNQLSLCEATFCTTEWVKNGITPRPIMKKEPMYDEQDKQTMDHVTACCNGVQLLGKLYCYDTISELALAKNESLPAQKKENYLLSVIAAEKVNQLVINPDNQKARQAVKQNQHPTCRHLTGFGSKSMDETLDKLITEISQTPTFKELTQIKDSELSDLILNQPQKITSTTAEISKEIANPPKPEVKKEEPKPEVKKEEPKPEVKQEIKQEEPKKEVIKQEIKQEEPKKEVIKQEKPKLVPAKPTDVESLKKRLTVAKLYSGKNAGNYISAMMEGQVSLHDPAAKDALQKTDPVSIVALFGQDPEKFPGQDGLTPMQKKMQYLENVMTKKEFTKSKEHQQFLETCRADYKAVKNSAYSEKTGSDKIKKFVCYLNEGANSMQQLAVRSPRMTITAPMLGACSQAIQQEYSTSRQLLFSDKDRQAMANVNARCAGIQLLGKAYTDSVKAEVALTNNKSTLVDVQKKLYLLNLMTAEHINQDYIAPTHKEAAQAVKGNRHPDTKMLDTLGQMDVDDTLAQIHGDIGSSSTFEALTQVKQSDISTAIQKQPMKIATASADISTELSNKKPVYKDVNKEVSKLFDPKNTLKENNIAVE